MTDSHPIHDPIRFQIETRASRQLEDTLQRWIWAGATGGVIRGSSRVGKTTAVELLSKRLKTRDGTPIPTHLFAVPVRDKPGVKSALENLCISAQLETKRCTQNSLAGSIIHFMKDRAKESSRFVLIVDEMQHLKFKQLEVFVELYNTMRNFGTTLTVFFVGNDDESSSLVDMVETESKDYAHIRGRFFMYQHEFHGLRSVDDVKACLNQYDILRYPDHGPSYTGYFLPEDFKDGFRLASLSGDLWEAFSTYKRSLGLSSWGMHYFVSTVYILLVDMIPSYGVDEVCSEMIHECIDGSALKRS